VRACVQGRRAPVLVLPEHTPVTSRFAPVQSDTTVHWAQSRSASVSPAVLMHALGRSHVHSKPFVWLLPKPFIWLLTTSLSYGC
jgi:hypothetical protein